MRVRAAAVVFLLAGLCGGVAQAGQPGRSQEGALVSPAVRILQAVADKGLRFLPPGIADSKGFVASLQFGRELDALTLRGLEMGGVEFARVVSSEGVDHVGPFYPAWVPWTSLEWLRAFPGMVQIGCEPLHKPLRPLDVTRPLTGAPELSQLLALTKGQAPGLGIDIGDIDSGIDVFHPSFFNADGGYFAWLDIQGDGTVAFGTDAVDLNGDGQAGSGEILRLFDTGLVNIYDQVNGWAEVNGNGVFDVGYDILYVDVNGNGQRDYGVNAGFSDSTPGFGEPMFVVDDVNGNNKLDPEEKLVMLGSSKIAKLWVGKTPYVRGEGLSKVYSLETFGSDESGYPTALHGTGVGGILVAGNPGLQRFVGMAPAANLHMYDNTHDDQSTWYDNSTLEKLVWAKTDGVDIMLYEFSMWGMEFMDGSSNLEKAMDQIFDKNGILNVVPAGNLGGAGKHMMTDVGPTGLNLAVDLPSEWPGYGYPLETPGLIISFYWKGEVDDLSLTLTPPGGSAVAVPANAPQSGIALPGDQTLYSYALKSGVGFTLQMIFIYDNAQKAVPSGTWQVGVDNNKGAVVPVHGFLMDYVAGWARTVTWKQFESDDTTLCHPSTAESAITVAAYAGQFGMPSELGKLRDYSSRGPRMDGVMGTDIGAPDDPYSAYPEMEMGWAGESNLLRGSYSVFGGTSGAGPHVAGTLALLLQAHPEMDAKGWRKALLDGVLVEDHMGAVPNKNWGHGKLNIYRSVTGQWPAPANHNPVASAKVLWREALYAGISAAESSDLDGDTLEYRFDFNYDGKWDTPWSGVPELEYGAKQPGQVRIKVVARDPAGAQDEFLLVYVADDQIIRPDEPVSPEPEEDVVTQEDLAQEDGVPSDLSGVDSSSDGVVGDVIVQDVFKADEVVTVPASGCAAGGQSQSSMLIMLVVALMVLGVGRRKI